MINQKKKGRGPYHPGVYLITNIINKKVYVGSGSYSLYTRLGDHKLSLRKGVHKNIHLQRAWNKYGEAAFVFEKLEGCNEEKVLEREQYWMDFFESYKKELGYNIAPKAGNSSGVKHTQETKKNMSNARKKLLSSEGYISPSLGRKVTDEEHKKKMESYVKAGIAKPLYALDKDLNIIGRYNSSGEASKFLDVDAGLIQRCLKNKYKTGKGIIFCFIDNLESKIREVQSNPFYFTRKKGIPVKKSKILKSIKVTNILTEEESIFQSTAEASRKIGITASMIWRVLNGQRISKEYKFEYL